MRRVWLLRSGFPAIGSIVLMLSSAIVATSAVGCRVDDGDIQRWETTQRGPDKLVAVITHDKYEVPLRVEAAMALVRMRPRNGRRVGITMMVDALVSLSDLGERNAIVSGLVPILVAEVSKPVPEPTDQRIADPSIPFKDAAFSLLSQEKPMLVTDEKQREALVQALSAWVCDAFEQRFDNAMQMFGVEQVVKYIGAPAAKGLPKLIENDQRRIPELARLIASSGDAATKDQASKRLVQVAEYTMSQKWIDALKPVVQEANASAHLKPTEAQFNAQLTTAQDEQLKRLFGAMRQLGGRPVVEFCLKYAANKDYSAERRTLAMAALEGNFDRQNPQDVQRILALASGEDTPDQVRDLAFRRVGEMPREKVISQLYKIFESKRWQARWVAAQYAISMSTTADIGEFLSHLPQGASPVFAMTEALSYGDWMGNPERMRVEGKDARAQLSAYFNHASSAVRTSALGWFFGHGTKHDITFLEKFYNDRGPLPRCGSDQVDCDWTCYVDKADAADTKADAKGDAKADGLKEAAKTEEKEAKEAKNIGEFVRYCIVPNIKDRDKDPTAAKKSAKQSSGSDKAGKADEAKEADKADKAGKP